MSRPARRRDAGSGTKAGAKEKKADKADREEPGPPDLQVAAGALSLSETSERSDGDRVSEQPSKDADADFEAPETRSRLSYVTTRRAWAQHVAESTRLSKKAATAKKPGKGSKK